jgi:hypothetical protein
LGDLHRRGDLRIRGREETGDLLGHGLVGSEAGKLGLPQIEVAACQPVEISGGIVCRTARRIVVFGGHDHTIAHHCACAAFA